MPPLFLALAWGWQRAATGYWLPTLVAAQKYLEKCLAEKIVPGVQQLMAALLPWAVVRGLVVPSADPPPMSMSQRAETL